MSVEARNAAILAVQAEVERQVKVHRENMGMPDYRPGYDELDLAAIAAAATRLTPEGGATRPVGEGVTLEPTRYGMGWAFRDGSGGFAIRGVFPTREAALAALATPTPARAEGENMQQLINLAAHGAPDAPIGTGAWCSRLVHLAEEIEAAALRRPAPGQDAERARKLELQTAYYAGALSATSRSDWSDERERHARDAEAYAEKAPRLTVTPVARPAPGQDGVREALIGLMEDYRERVSEVIACCGPHVDPDKLTDDDLGENYVAARAALSEPAGRP